MLSPELADGSREPLLQGPFQGQSEFAQAIRNALETAAMEGWAEMVWSDPNFEDWPLRERSVIASLQGWAGKGRKLILLAHNFDSIVRLHPRFVGWRVQWDHIIECRTCRNRDATEVPSAFWSPSWVMRRLDFIRSNGYAGIESSSRLSVREDLDECLRQSSPGFPASTLGL
jgi:hypothetical protein